MFLLNKCCEFFLKYVNILILAQYYLKRNYDLLYSPVVCGFNSAFEPILKSFFVSTCTVYRDDLDRFVFPQNKQSTRSFHKFLNSSN